MDKQVIKITESDIHKIVKESVNKVLTELDWRTYANAAKKRDAQIQQLGRDATDKGGNRLTHLRNNLDYAASDALTSKYAQRHNNGYPTNNADVYTKTVIRLLQPTILMVMEGGQEANSIMITKVI